ncbi:MAG TPA: type II toxin-antitoxin system VapC family toxin [Candidatus Acidoferrum sp.]|nr:type II toxin-antitoxin system VapC family toxin [Candidatus Acidoferrum sp.]
MTTPSGSDRYVVDSSGWVEFLGNGPKADAFARYLENPETLLLPTIVVYEVYKKMLREQDVALAERFLSTAFSFQEREIVLDVSLAALAAKRSVTTNLPMADAIIYATAQAHQAELVTSDAHFTGLPGVTLI